MTAPAPGAGFQAEVYSYADPTTFLDFLPRRTQFQCLDEIKNVGGGSITFPANDPKITETLALLEYQNVVKMRLDGRVVGAFLAQNKEIVTVSPGEHADEQYKISGEGLRSWFRMATVEPFGGLKPWSATSRRFSFTSEIDSWYDAALWNFPVRNQQYNMDPNNGTWGTAPAQWPDVPTAWWIWGTAGQTHPAGTTYFRYTFDSTLGGKHSLFCAGDDRMTVYIDGEQVIQTEIGEWSQTIRADFTLTPGQHIIAFAVTNETGGGGLIAALFRGSTLLTSTGGIDQQGWQSLPYPEQYPGWTAGEIMLTLLDEAQDRGVRFPAWLTPTFTEKLDSNGNPWDTTLDWVFDVGTELIDVIAQMEEVGVDLWIDPDTFQLHMADTRGVDRSVQTTTAEPVSLRIAHNLTQAGEQGKSEIKNALAVRTDTGWLISTDETTNSLPKYGRVEGLLSTNLNQDLSRAVVSSVFTRKALPWTSSTYMLTPKPGAVPYEDFGVGDWILAPDAAKVMTRVRVLSLSVSESGRSGGPDYAIEFGTIAEDAEDRFNRWLKALNKGSLSGSVSNTSPVVSKPPADVGLVETENRSPAAPLNLQASTFSYIDPSGNAQGTLVASWAAVTTAVDGSVLEVAGYEMAVRIGGTTAPWMHLASTEELRAEYGPLPVATSVAVKVRARGVYATKPGRWSSIVTVVVQSDTIAPPVPSTLTLVTRLGTIQTFWDGKTSAGASMPPDFSRIEIAMGSATNPTAVITTQVGAGVRVITDQPYNATRYFRSRAVDRSGNVSAWTPSVSIATAPLVQADMNTDLFNQISSKNQIFYEPSTAPPTATQVDDLWFQTNNDNAPYRWNGTAWIPAPLGDEAIANLDAGKLTAGVIATERLAAGTISAEKLAVGPSNLVVDPLFLDAEINANRLSNSAYAPLSFGTDATIALNGGRYVVMSRTATTTVLNLSPSDDFASAPVEPGQSYRIQMHVKASATAAGLGWRFLVHTRRTDGSLLSQAVSGYVLPPTGWTWYVTNYVVPNDVTHISLGVETSLTAGQIYLTRPAFAPRVGTTLIEDGAISTNKIQANAITANLLEVGLVLSTKIIAGNPVGAHAAMEPSGFRAYRAAEVGLVPEEVIRLGTDSDDYFGVVSGTGELLASINDKGLASFSGVNVRNTLSYKGRELSTILADYPRGLVAQGFAASAAINGVSGEYGLLEVVADLEAGRIYSIEPSLLYSLTDTNCELILRVRTTGANGGTPDAASGTTVMYRQFSGANAGYATLAEASGLYSPSASGQFRFLLTATRGGTGTSVNILNTNPPPLLKIVDLGRNVANTGVVNRGTPGATTSAVKTRTVRVAATWTRSYLPSNAWDSSAGRANRMYQGYQSASLPDHSLAGFPDQTSLLSGATVNYVYIEWYFPYWKLNSGGTARVGVHGLSTDPGAAAQGEGQYIGDVANWPKPGLMTVDLSDTAAGWKSGAYRGVSLGRYDGSVDPIHVGWSSPPTLVLNYTK